MDKNIFYVETATWYVVNTVMRIGNIPILIIVLHSSSKKKQFIEDCLIKVYISIYFLKQILFK